MIPTTRLAQPDDADALSRVARDCFIDTFGRTYRPQDLTAFLAATYSPALQRVEIEEVGSEHRLALDEAGEIVAFATVATVKLPIEAPESALELRRLYVVRPWQGRGVAAHLMDWAVARATERGASAMYLGVWRHNVRAQRFYARYGFKKVGEYLFAVGEARDEEDILELLTPTRMTA